MILKKTGGLLILLISLVILTQCKKFTQTSWVYYDETYCADTWVVSSTEETEKKINIKKFLKSKDIKVFKVQIIKDGTAQFCHSCGCKSGNRVKCQIKDKDKSKAIALKFY